FDQVAPPLYLWAAKTCHLLLGPAELSLRLPAVAAGIASLFLMARLARLTIPRGPALVAVALLALSYYPARHASDVKPYASALLASLLLLVPTATWLRTQDRAPLAWLAALVPAAVAMSYPAAFVGGAAALALLPGVWGSDDRVSRLLFATYNVLLVGTF